MISPWLISELVSSVESIKFPKLRKNWEFWEISRKISKKNRNLLALVQMFAVSTLSVSTHLFVLKNRTSKMEHRKHLIIPWNWNILNSKILVKMELTSLWISFGFWRILGIIMSHEKEGSILKFLKFFGFLKWCNDDWLEESYEVNLRSDYR